MAILSYPGTPGTMLYGGRQKELPATGRGVDTSISIKNDGASLTSAPVTMGFSFPQGALALEENDLHATVDGAEIPMQADSYASYPDGSIRFAVLSMNPGTIAAGATKSVRLQTGNKKSAFNGTLTAPSLNFIAEATVYGVKGVVVRLGEASAYALDQTLTFDIVSNGVTTTYVITCDDSMRYGAVGNRIFTQYAIGNVVAAAITAGGIYRARREWGGDQIVIEPIADDHGDFTVSVVHSGSAVITQSVENSYAAPVVWTATMQDVLTTQISESNAGTITPHLRRLHGPVVSEFRQMVKFKNEGGTVHDFLTAIFDIRLYADGKIWVDTTVENTGLNAPNPRTLHYKMRLLNGATELHSIPRFAHHSRMRWHKPLWIGEAAQTLVNRDMSYLFSTLATPTYSLDSAHAPTNAEINNLANTIATRAAAQAYRGPLACTLLEQGMPNTGGRPEIGLIAGYEVDYLLSQGATTRKHIHQAADDAGAFAMHFRDETTGWPVALDNNSNVEVGNIFPTVTHATELLPTIPDTAHQGSFHYIPYLLEGSAFHLDGLMFWTSWNLTRGNRTYRSSPSVGQLMDGVTTGLRKIAWPLRSAAMTAFVMPDAHPRKAYYRNQLTANLVNMDAQKGVSWFNGPFGVQTIGDGRSDSWMGDFMTAVLGWMKLNGEDVSSLLAHIAEFQFGRVLHAGDGLCPQWGVDYFMRVAATEAEVANITSWSQIAVAAGGARYGQACAFASGDDVDYAAVFRGAAAICADAGVPFAAQAYDVWVPLTPSLNVPSNQTRRKWAFQRRI